MKHHNTIKHMANCFRIWRAGSSVDWNCTIADIADETGINSKTVADICRRKNWKTVEDNEGKNASRLSVDVAMSLPRYWVEGRV